MADALLCEASLKLLNWNLCDWISMFEMFKLFTSSVPAVNPRVV